MKLSPTYRQILDELMRRGGSMAGMYFTGQYRGLASKMQQRGLVLWEKGADGRERNLNNWTLHITPAGRAALEAEKERGTT